MIEKQRFRERSDKHWSLLHHNSSSDFRFSSKRFETLIKTSFQELLQTTIQKGVEGRKKNMIHFDHS